MTIPELEEALQKQQALFEKFAKDLSNTVENIKELRHQIGVPVSPPPSVHQTGYPFGDTVGGSK